MGDGVETLAAGVGDGVETLAAGERDGVETLAAGECDGVTTLAAGECDDVVTGDAVAARRLTDESRAPGCRAMPIFPFVEAAVRAGAARVTSCAQRLTCPVS